MKKSTIAFCISMLASHSVGDVVYRSASSYPISDSRNTGAAKFRREAKKRRRAV